MRLFFGPIYFRLNTCVSLIEPRAPLPRRQGERETKLMKARTYRHSRNFNDLSRNGTGTGIQREIEILYIVRICRKSPLIYHFVLRRFISDILQGAMKDLGQRVDSKSV